MMMKRTASVIATVALVATTHAHAFEPRVSVGAVVGMTGLGPMFPGALMKISR